jgi:hypothetical protein
MQKLWPTDEQKWNDDDDDNDGTQTQILSSLTDFSLYISASSAAVSLHPLITSNLNTFLFS